jgi:flagellar FliJ protein
MKRFRFRLQRVLDLRVQIRDEARQELVRRNQERDYQINILRHLEDEYRRTSIQEGGTYSAGDLVLLGTYCARLQKQIEHQQEVVAKARKEAEQAQERYVETSRDAKALEMLREKKLQEHTEQMLREEGAMLDEIAIQRAGRSE